MSIYATMVGGLTLARAVTDPTMSAAMLDATRDATLAIRNSATGPLPN